jgi:hypothetical protein
MWKYHKETPWVTTFISNKLKCHAFLFIFSCFFYKIGQQEGRKSPDQWRGAGPRRREEVMR